MTGLKARVQHFLRKPVGVWLLASGALMTLGFAPFGLWPVAVISLAILWLAVRHAASARQAAGAALVWGMGHQLTALYWLPWAFYKDAGNSMAAAIGGGVPAVIGLSLYGALGYALVCVLAWHVAAARVGTYRLGWRWGSAAWVLGWVIVEFVKGLTPLGFPWLPVGAVWAVSVPLMQAASLGGVWLLSALVLGLALLTAQALERGAPHWQPLAGIIALLAAVYGFGACRLHSAPATSPAAPMVRVVQPNIQSAHKWDAQMRWLFLQETLDVALAGPGSPPATVVMPETAVAFYLDEEDMVRQAVADRLAHSLPGDGALVTGTVRREPVYLPDGQVAALPRFFNSLAMLLPNGRLTGMYDKRLLVPFGEYIPFRPLLERLPLPGPLRTLSQSRLDYTPGRADPLLLTPAGAAVGLICYEGIFPLPVLHAARGARYLVNITNDNWFTGTIALYQHAALARLRTVESGLPLVRVANTGLTVVYDAYGREVARLPINTATHADIPLPPAAPPTVLEKLTAALPAMR
jgi:apolipoprotein N-acyltransferase